MESVEELESRLDALKIKSEEIEEQVKTIKKESIELKFLVVRLLHKNRNGNT